MTWFEVMYNKEKELNKREAEIHEREERMEGKLADAQHKGYWEGIDKNRKLVGDQLDQLNQREAKLNVHEADLAKWEKELEKCEVKLDMRDKDLNAEYCDQNIERRTLEQREEELDEYSDNLDAQAERLKEQEEKTCLTVRWNLDRLAEKLRKQDLELCERRMMTQIQEEETAKKFKRAHEKEKELNEREFHIEREGQLNQCAAEVLVQREEKVIQREADLNRTIADLRVTDMNEREKELDEREERHNERSKDLGRALKVMGDRLTNSYNRGLVDGRKDSKEEQEEERVSDYNRGRVDGRKDANQLRAYPEGPEDTFTFDVGDTQFCIKRKHLIMLEGNNWTFCY